MRRQRLGEALRRQRCGAALERQCLRATLKRRRPGAALRRQQFRTAPKRQRPRAALLLLAALAGIVIGPGVGLLGGTDPVAAHPLGNFSVNHYHGLRLHPDRIDDTAVIDEAEIPTMQARTRVDRDRDGTVTATERASYAGETCRRLAAALRLEVDNEPVAWTMTRSAMTYHPGAARLQTSRTECDLTAPAALHRPATVSVTDRYGLDRLGWHEITASGADGVRLDEPAVPGISVSNQLRDYPDDELSSPLDQRSVTLHARPGTGAAAAPDPVTPAASGPVSRTVEALTHHFTSMVGSPRLTLFIGLAGVALALLLGAGHAMLPGHGKTVMAAYLAGRRGSTRDALTVGLAVTATHTAGVLVLGLVLTFSTALAGETMVVLLGAASGVLITAVGATLLASALFRSRRHIAGVAHTHVHAHEHDAQSGHHHVHHNVPLPGGRRGLIGMGVAGGLAPSPSALVVLLGAIALGRTWFGVILVLAYGVGMAATLTAAGLLLVLLRDRMHASRSRWINGWTGRWSGRWSSAAPVLTAGLVLVVGLGIASRNVIQLLGGPL